MLLPVPPLVMLGSKANSLPRWCQVERRRRSNRECPAGVERHKLFRRGDQKKRYPPVLRLVPWEHRQEQRPRRLRRHLGQDRHRRPLPRPSRHRGQPAKRRRFPPRRHPRPRRSRPSRSLRPRPPNTRLKHHPRPSRLRPRSQRFLVLRLSRQWRKYQNLLPLSRPNDLGKSPAFNLSAPPSQKLPQKQPDKRRRK
jgi:hypothetical protein